VADDHLSPVPADPSADLTKREPAAPVEELKPALLERPSGETPPEEVHGFRFRMAYALLAVVLGAAVGALIVLVGRDHSSTSGSTWSFWKPDGRNDFEKSRDIALTVGGQYRLPSGRQLVAVIPHSPPEVQSSQQQVPITHVALIEGTGSKQNDISVFSASNSIEYILCGVGRGSQNCAITEGQPTLERGRLLHRESLELALYSFKYLDVDSVVTLLPPRPDAQNPPTYALYFQKNDFKSELNTPIATTLPGFGPFTTKTFPPLQQEAVGRLITPHLFQYQYQQALDGSALLVLSPVPL
jgi:hypothetical protein